jgi:hypothetical protein
LMCSSLTSIVLKSNYFNHCYSSFVCNNYVDF